MRSIAGAVVGEQRTDCALPARAAEDVALLQYTSGSTGDLGYIALGELFVTGCAKDVIIRGGQHVHPYEVEEAIGRIPACARPASPCSTCPKPPRERRRS